MTTPVKMPGNFLIKHHHTNLLYAYDTLFLDSAFKKEGKNSQCIILQVHTVYGTNGFMTLGSILSPQPTTCTRETSSH
jgi:hypothetical protein